MLQTRLENEQFNSLPVLFTNSRSRNDFLNLDRPDSSQLVDLHVYIIPKNVWKNFQHLAQNEAMEEAISAGFVRVSPEMKLFNLRESIEMSCGREIFFPKEFIFLRSVGRNLARVKPSQENELKVKHYRPPQTSASEIYLLEGRHEDYGNIPSVSPALSSASYIFGRHYRYRLIPNEYAQESSRLSRYFHRQPVQIEKDTNRLRHKTRFPSQNQSSDSKSWLRMTPIGSDESSPNLSVTTSITLRELNKLKEEQERLRHRQGELERMRRAVEDKKHHLDREEEDRERRRKQQLDKEEEERQRRRKQLSDDEEEKEHQRRRKQLSDDEEEKERQRRKLEHDKKREKEEQEEDEKERRRKQEKAEEERRRRKKEKEHNEHEQDERKRRRRRQEKEDTERRQREKLEKAATKIQATYRGYKGRKAFRDRQKNLLKSAKSNTTKNLDINDDELSDGSEILSRSSIESTSDLDSNVSRSETRTINKQFRESIQSNSSSSLLSMKTERKIRSNPSSSSYTITTNDENRRAATVTKTRQSDDETYELKRRRDLSEERRKAKELEEQRRRDLAKAREPRDLESLRLRLQELRKGRYDLEKVRDEIIKNLKYVHQRVTLRRKEARDMWKKKYFQEKKKTPPIEGQITQLKTDLDLIHSKIIQIIDNECKHSAQAGCVHEAETGNLILQILRTQYETQNTRQQLDQAKLRLTTDLKLRNQAENECRSLKHELSQAKMNLNHIKNRLTC